MSKLISIVLLWCAAPGQILAQTFEVESVKPATPLGPAGMRTDRRGGPGTTDPGMYTCTNCPVSWVLSEGYDLMPFELIAPDWLDTARFDFLAKIPAGTTKEDFRIMLQNLLASRFKLAVHREKKEMQIYELTVAKNGPKFRESVPATAPEDDGPVDLKKDKDGFPILTSKMSMAVIPGHARIRSNNQPISWFVRTLAAQLHGPVIDATELKGKYDFLLSWEFEDGPHATPSAGGEIPVTPALAPYLPALLNSIQSQLGLKVEQKKARADVLVVDHIEKQPSAN